MGRAVEGTAVAMVVVMEVVVKGVGWEVVVMAATGGAGRAAGRAAARAAGRAAVARVG